MARFQRARMDEGYLKPGSRCISAWNVWLTF